MKRNNKSKPSKLKAPIAKAASSEATYFRLCHLCFHLNEADQPIMECEECTNMLSAAPIDDFYDDIFEAQTDSRRKSNEELEEERELRNSLPPDPEIKGLSVIW